MPRRQRDQASSPRVEERIGPNQERTHLLLGKAGEGRTDILVRATIQNDKSWSEAACRFLHIFDLPFPLRAVLVHEQGDQLSTGNEVPQQPEPLCSQQSGEKGDPRRVCAGPIQIRDKAFLDWVCGRTIFIRRVSSKFPFSLARA
jgi:hypothetical protein